MNDGEEKIEGTNDQLGKTEQGEENKEKQESEKNDKRQEESKKAAKMADGNLLMSNLEIYTSGEDFDMWIERVDILLKINKVEEDEKVDYMISMGGGELYKIIKSLISPKKVEEVKYDDLKKILSKNFKPTRNIIAERFKFNKRKQSDDETISDFVVAIKSLARECEFGTFLKEALRDNFVCGIRKEKIQNRLLNETELDFEKAISIATNMELTEAEMKEIKLKNIPSAVNAVQNKREYGRDISKNPISAKEFYRDRRSKFTRNQSPNRRMEKTSQVTSKDYKSNWICYNCRKPGHIARYCQERRQEPKLHYVTDEDEEGDIEGSRLGHIGSIESEPDEPLTMQIEVSENKMSFEIDTGACDTFIDLRTYDRYFPNYTLYKVERGFKVVTGDNVLVLGAIKVKVLVKGHDKILRMIVLKTERSFLPLLGRSWLKEICPGWKRIIVDNIKHNTEVINKLQSNLKVSEVMGVKEKERYLEGLRARYINCFRHNDEPISGYEAEIILKDEAVPIFCAARTVPYGLKEKVEKAFDKLIQTKKAVLVRHSDWATPLVFDVKKNGDIRTCLDCKVTINKYTVTDHYPMPRFDDIMVEMQGCTVFCKLDLEGAYQQLSVTENSQKYLTANTHIGLLRYTRLVEGVSSAGAIFQSVMDRILHGVRRTRNFIDDILIGGKDLESCKAKVEEVMKKLSKHNVKINYGKCEFFVNEIEYLGHVLTSEGLKTCPAKIEAIMEAPVPENVSQLKSFLGMINYYGKFLPDLSSELHPLYDLLKKNVRFCWSKSCEEAFRKVKEMLVKDHVLELYDPGKPLAISCDASPYGVGAVLSHVIGNVEKPIMYISSSLSSSERNYAQLHREALSVVWAVKKFHKYIYGRPFVIYNDHEPLKDIFSPVKGGPPVAAARIQRWQILLSMYDYQLKYRKASQMRNADALSRLPLKQGTGMEECSIHSFNLSERIPLDKSNIASATEIDEVLSRVVKYTVEGWPNKVDDKFNRYFAKRVSLSVESGCLFYGERIMIPEALKVDILRLMHEGHLGIVRMKSLARRYVYWLGIDSDIENWCQSCEPCQTQEPRGSGIKTEKWPESESPFERVHLDFFFFKKDVFMILVDSFSKFFDVNLMNKTDAGSVIGKLRTLFAYFGLPKTIVSDNGPPFNSKKFETFCTANGIRFRNSPIYHPQSNGLAERGVQTVKMALRKFLVDERYRNMSTQYKIDNFLFKYRNTPSTTTNKYPSELIFNYRPRTLMENLKTTSDHGYKRSEIGNGQNEKKTSTIEKITEGEISFKEGDKIWYKYNHNYEFKWLPAVVVRKLGNKVYKIKVNDTTKEVHGAHIKKRIEKKVRFELCNFDLPKKAPQIVIRKELPKLSIYEKPKRQIVKPEKYGFN